MLVAFEVEYGTTCKLGGSAGRIDGQIEVRMRGRQRSGMFHLGDLLRLSNTLKDRPLMSVLPEEFRAVKVARSLNNTLVMLSNSMKNDTLLADLQWSGPTGTCKLEVRASIVVNNLLHANLPPQV